MAQALRFAFKGPCKVLAACLVAMVSLAVPGLAERAREHHVSALAVADSTPIVPTTSSLLTGAPQPQVDNALPSLFTDRPVIEVKLHYTPNDTPPVTILRPLGDGSHQRLLCAVKDAYCLSFRQTVVRIQDTLTPSTPLAIRSVNLDPWFRTWTLVVPGSKSTDSSEPQEHSEGITLQPFLLTPSSTILSVLSVVLCVCILPWCCLHQRHDEQDDDVRNVHIRLGPEPPQCGEYSSAARSPPCDPMEPGSDSVQPVAQSTDGRAQAQPDPPSSSRPARNQLIKAERKEPDWGRINELRQVGAQNRANFAARQQREKLAAKENGLRLNQEAYRRRQEIAKQKAEEAALAKVKEGELELELEVTAKEHNEKKRLAEEAEEEALTRKKKEEEKAKIAKRQAEEDLQKSMRAAEAEAGKERARVAEDGKGIAQASKGLTETESPSIAEEPASAQVSLQPDQSSILVSDCQHVIEDERSVKSMASSTTSHDSEGIGGQADDQAETTEMDWEMTEATDALDRYEEEAKGVEPKIKDETNDVEMEDVSEEGSTSSFPPQISFSSHAANHIDIPVPFASSVPFSVGPQADIVQGDHSAVPHQHVFQETTREQVSGLLPEQALYLSPHPIFGNDSASASLPPLNMFGQSGSAVSHQHTFQGTTQEQSFGPSPQQALYISPNPIFGYDSASASLPPPNILGQSGSAVAVQGNNFEAPQLCLPTARQSISLGSHQTVRQFDSNTAPTAQKPPEFNLSIQNNSTSGNNLVPFNRPTTAPVTSWQQVPWTFAPPSRLDFHEPDRSATAGQDSEDTSGIHATGFQSETTYFPPNTDTSRRGIDPSFAEPAAPINFQGAGGSSQQTIEASGEASSPLTTTSASVCEQQHLHPDSENDAESMEPELDEVDQYIHDQMLEELMGDGSEDEADDNQPLASQRENDAEGEEAELDEMGLYIRDQMLEGLMEDDSEDEADTETVSPDKSTTGITSQATPDAQHLSEEAGKQIEKASAAVLATRKLAPKKFVYKKAIREKNEAEEAVAREREEEEATQVAWAEMEKHQ